MPPVDRNNPRRAKSSESTYTLMEFTTDFPDDATCLSYLWRRNHSHDGERAECPKCKRTRRFHRLAKHPAYSCDTCGHHIHPTAGTIFHKSSTSLVLWFHAIFLMSQTRCGISAKQLERELGVTYKTAWRMFNKIRSLLAHDDDDPLSGEVEIDETYVGGKRKNRGKAGRPTAKRSHKQPVLGMVERRGRIVATTVPNATRATLMPHVTRRVLPDTMIYTDEWHAYGTLTAHGFWHRRVRHSENTYVAGPAHTNTIEGFFGLLKNGIRGVYHSVSKKHLQSYLDEYTWRYNHRYDREPMFMSLLSRAASRAS